MSASLRRTLSRVFLRAACLVVIAVVGLFVEDRLARPSLMGFDPARMGKLEASMWRDYYEHRWFSLAADGLRVSCGEYGFSIRDGVVSSLFAARAAHHFSGNTNDPRCLPLLRRYYKVIAASLGRDFDTAEAAGLELEWWKERRRKLPPEVYGRTVAENVAIVYGLSPQSLLPSALARARAMDYRDRHGRNGEMSAGDWDEVARQLTEAYALLKNAAAGKEPAGRH